MLLGGRSWPQSHHFFSFFNSFFFCFSKASASSSCWYKGLSAYFFAFSQSFFFFFSDALGSSYLWYNVWARSFSICRVPWDGGPAAVPGVRGFGEDRADWKVGDDSLPEDGGDFTAAFLSGESLSCSRSSPSHSSEGWWVSGRPPCSSWTSTGGGLLPGETLATGMPGSSSFVFFWNGLKKLLDLWCALRR